MESTESVNAEPVQVAGKPGEQPLGQLATALLELGRALRGRRFHAAHHPLLRETIERAFAALGKQLERSEPLVLAVEATGFRDASGISIPEHDQIGELARELALRGVQQLQLDRRLDAQALRALLDTTAMPRQELTGEEAFAHKLYARSVRGITVNQVPQLAQAPAPVATPSSAAVEKLDLEADPFAETSPEPRAVELCAWLRELEACREDGRYAELVRQVRQRAALLAEEGAKDEGYRACLVLSAHATPRAGRGDAQKAAAFDALRALATGTRLTDLIDRACAPAGAASMRAAQILLQLGASAAPAVLREIEAAREEDRRAQLSGIVIAMGKKATSEILRALESDDARRARNAAYLAGEIQGQDCVAALQKLVRGADAEARREAAKALAKIGSEAALEALIEALGSELPEVPALAAYCLGATGNAHAVQALASAVRRAARDGELELAREAIRALGRLGDAAAVPELAALLARRALFGAKRLAELKLAAASALARLPGDAAQKALSEAAQNGDERVRDVARAALARRTEPAAS